MAIVLAHSIGVSAAEIGLGIIDAVTSRAEENLQASRPPSPEDGGSSDRLTETVLTTYGPVTGTLLPSGVRVWKGIPYAAPPVGSLRWRPPQGPGPWSEPRTALAFGPGCPQLADGTFESVAEQSEDCLTLNVWTPAQTTADNLPVMVWVHGGGFNFGGSSISYYDGAMLAGEGLVLVSINYRLGALGFLAHPELSHESMNNVSGNYGVLDQIFALQWVRDNIKKFGGGAHRVTLFGESAGGSSVMALMASPLARGLFHGAVAQSGTFASIDQSCLRTACGATISREERGIEFASRLGVTGSGQVAQLRSRPWEDLIAAGDLETARILAIYPSGKICVDGHVLTEQPRSAFSGGRQAAVPLLVGSTKDEGTKLAAAIPYATRTGLAWALSLLFSPAQTVEAFSLYDVVSDTSVATAYPFMITDGGFSQPARFLAQSQSRLGPSTFLYYFDYAPFYNGSLGAYHGFEIPFVFGNLGGAPLPQDVLLSDAMMGYWVHFAKTGGMGGAGPIDWPPWSETAPTVLRFDAGWGVLDLSTGTGSRGTYLEFWDRVRGVP